MHETTPCGSPAATGSPASRRALLGMGAALGTTTLLGCSSSRPSGGADGADSDGASSGSSAPPSTLELTTEQAVLGDAPATGFQLFSDESINFSALFALGGSGLISEVGEVVTAVNQANTVEGGATFQSYFDAMVAMGNATAQRAGEARSAGHLVTARDRFLRAAQYYDQALFFVLGTSTPQQEQQVYETMASMWASAAAMFEPAWERVSIPYEDSDLPAWFLAPPATTGRRPTVILNNGSDGQNIDLWAWGAYAAIQRGWNALILEGPGQGEMLFVREVPFRPDWEAVITPVVDYLSDRGDVDRRRIALIGWSQGGELVARAAAFEHRLAAVVTDPGCVDVYDAFPEPLRQVAEGDEAAVNSAWKDGIIPGASPEQRFELSKRLEIYSTEALRQARSGQVPTDWYGLSRRIQEFQVREVAGEIRSPVLIVDYDQEQFYPGQPTELEGLLRSPTSSVKFTVAEGAQYHCAPMAPQYRNEVLFDWLDVTVAGDR